MGAPKWSVFIRPEVVPFKVVIVTIIYLLYCKYLTRCNTLSLDTRKAVYLELRRNRESLR